LLRQCMPQALKVVFATDPEVFIDQKMWPIWK